MEVSPATAQEELETIFAGMDDIHPEVTASNTEYSPDVTAKVTLDYFYDIGESGWKYQTEAKFSYTGGEWQLLWSPSLVHSMLNSDTRLRHTREWPKRAAINDNAGLALVEQRTLFQVGIDKSQLDASQWESSARDLARLLEIDQDAYVEKVKAGGEKQFVVGKTVRQEAVSEDIGLVAGGLVVPVEANVAPSDTFALSILGTTGHPSPEQLEESDGKLWESDVVGLSGLQARYDDRLRGTPEVRVDLVARKTDDPDAVEFEDRNLFLQEAEPGEPLNLSMDRALQTKAEQVLSEQSGLAALVVIDVADGGVLAAANSEAAGSYPQATYGKFAPGSTFKVISALAMLRDGASPDSKVSCPSSLDVNGYRIGNYSGYPGSKVGQITLSDALAYSCNTAFAQAAGDVTPEELHGAAGSLGVGTDYDAGFTSYFGTVEPTDNEIDRAASMFGQGQITVSPFAMALVAASVARGETTIGWLVEGEQAASTAEPLSETEAGQLQSMMKQVVDSGTAKVLKGKMTGAKTGTAEFGESGNQQTHAWMIAWNGEVAVAAFVEVGESGSKDAAPLIIDLFS